MPTKYRTDNVVLIRDILKQMRTRMDAGWCQEAGARNKQGFECPATSRAAVKWCMVGARERALIDVKVPPEKRGAFQDTIDTLLANVIDPQFQEREDSANESADLVIDFNDGESRKKKDVLRVVDATIKHLPKVK